MTTTVTKYWQRGSGNQLLAKADKLAGGGRRPERDVDAKLGEFLRQSERHHDDGQKKVGGCQRHERNAPLEERVPRNGWHGGAHGCHAHGASHDDWQKKVGGGERHDEIVGGRLETTTAMNYQTAADWSKIIDNDWWLID